LRIPIAPNAERILGNASAKKGAKHTSTPENEANMGAYSGMSSTRNHCWMSRCGGRGDTAGLGDIFRRVSEVSDANRKLRARPANKNTKQQISTKTIFFGWTY